MTRNISMIQGDTLSFGIDITETNGDDTAHAFSQELTAATFSVKDDQTTTVVWKTLNDGISKVDEGQYVVRVAPIDTLTLPAGDYYYDCKISANGDTFTILRGLFRVKTTRTE